MSAGKNQLVLDFCTDKSLNKFLVMQNFKITNGIDGTIILLNFQ